MKIKYTICLSSTFLVAIILLIISFIATVTGIVFLIKDKGDMIPGIHIIIYIYWIHLLFFCRWCDCVI